MRKNGASLFLLFDKMKLHLPSAGDPDRQSYQEEMRLETGDYHRREEFCALSTGSALLDDSLATGGYPMGTISEWYGAPGTGKTTFALLAVSEAQRRGETVAYFDLEGTLDAVYAASLGIDLERMVVLRPTTAADALEMSATLVRGEAVMLMVYDSTAALCTETEGKSLLGEKSAGENWRKGVERLVFGVYNLLRSHPCTAVFISQTRNYTTPFGEFSEQSTGGLVLQHLAAVRLCTNVAEMSETDYLINVHIEKGAAEGVGRDLKIRREFRK